MMCISIFFFPFNHPLINYFIIASGEVDAAKSMLSHCLDQDSTFSDAHLLMAQVLLCLLVSILFHKRVIISREKGV